MKVGEIRTFKIDKNKKKECKLPGKGIIEIEIIKEESSVAEFALRLAEFALHEAYLLCDNGYINYVRTEGKAEKCGIARIFTEICMNEKKIHNTKDTAKNKALIQLEEYLQACGKRSSCKENDEHLKKIRDLKDWSETHCSKFMYLIMTAKGGGAHVYFNSAVASGFTEMFMMSDLTDEELVGSNYQEDIYPKSGPCAVKTLQERYSDDRTMLDGEEKTSVGGWNWFFCHPKKPNNNPKCTIL